MTAQQTSCSAASRDGHFEARNCQADGGGLPSDPFRYRLLPSVLVFFLMGFGSYRLWLAIEKAPRQGRPRRSAPRHESGRAALACGQ